MADFQRMAQMPPVPHSGPTSRQLLEKSLIAIIVISALYFGSELFVPLAIAVLLAFALSPVVRFMRRRRVPQVVAVSLTVLLTFLMLFAVGAIVTRQVTELGTALPRYQAALQEKVRTISALTGGKGGAIERAGETLRDLQREIETPDPAVPATEAERRIGAPRDVERPIPVEVHAPPPTAVQQISSIIAVALAPLATVGVIVVFVVFLLLKQTDVRDRVIRLIGAHDLERTTTAFDDAARRLSSYFLSLVVMNAGFGAVIGAGLWLIGIPNPILWGIIAMLLRFMPVVGVFIAAAIPVVLAAAVDHGWFMVFAVVTLYLVVEAFMNLVVETWLQATSTGLSVLAILLAASFWTLLWGPIGLLIAVPLTAVLVVMGRHVEGLGFLHVLLGDAPALTPPESFYQRMLAGDPHEAAEAAERLLGEMTATEYFDGVVMEGLRMAQTDADLGKLDPSRLPDIRDTALAMIEQTDGLEEEGAATSPDEDAAAPASAWRAEGAIVCVAGQSALDELAAMLLVRLLRQQGFAPRLLKMADISAAVMQGAEAPQAKLVIISAFDADRRTAYLKFLVRRLKRHLPGAALLGGFWRSDAPGPRQTALADIVSEQVRSLAEAVAAASTRAPTTPAEPAQPAPPVQKAGTA